MLDIGAGAGSYALIHLQNRGLAVTALDVSRDATEVCREWGCRGARVMDVRELDVGSDRYRAFIVIS